MPTADIIILFGISLVIGNLWFLLFISNSVLSLITYLMLISLYMFFIMNVFSSPEEEWGPTLYILFGTAFVYTMIPLSILNIPVQLFKLYLALRKSA